MISTLISDPILFLLMVPVVLISLTLHEYAHAFTAYKLGDPTAKDAGRLTLNPLKHFNLAGSIAMFIFGFGWANPVPINPAYFKKPKNGMALVAFMGPLTNLAISLLAVIGYATSIHVLSSLVYATFSYYLAYYCGYFFYLLFYVNLSYCFFNLIPITPLDGSRILSLILPDKANRWLIMHEKQVYLFVIIYFLFGSHVSSFLLNIPFISNNVFLSFFCKLLDFSTYFSKLISIISQWILSMISF